MDASEHFDTYRAAWPERAPNLPPGASDDERREMTTLDGRCVLACGDPGTTVPEVPFQLGDRFSPNEIALWLVLAKAVVYAQESGAWGAARERGRLAHTNLSGGRAAHVGGEVVFHDGFVLLNGGSSRYRARTREELRMATEAWANAGYHVFCMGWDEVGPARTWAANNTWTILALRNEP